MKDQKSIVVQAKSVDQALKKAAEQLGVGKDSLSYDLLSQSDAGFLSFLGGRKVEIKAWVARATSAPTASNSNRQSGRPPRRSGEEEDGDQLLSKEPLKPEELSGLIEDLREFCSGVCGFLVSKSGIQVNASLEDDRLTLDIDDEDIASQIGKNTRLAESMEHILRKKPRYLKRELPFRIFVDAKRIRINRETELVEMAKDLSMKVAQNQRPIVLNYKSSYDRKIIHMALDKDERVYTKSIGSGANRKLMILPIKDESGRPQHQDRE